jgi:hypothetical protein
MTITLIDFDTYQLLAEIQKSYPNLTYQNVGYDYPNKSNWSDEDKAAFNTVNNILEKSIEGFVIFNHFRIDKNNIIRLRFQYHYDASFIGVGYLKLDELFNGFDKYTNES